MDEACSMLERNKNASKIFVPKPEGNRPCGRTRYRWEDNIRMNLKATGLRTGDSGELL